MVYRIGFLGASHVHTAGYIGEANQHPELELAGFYESDPSIADEIKEKFSMRWFDSPEEVIAVSDAVVICGINADHAKLIDLAAQANTHVFCEKPVAIYESELSEIRESIAGKSSVFMTAFPCPYSPAFNRLVSRIAAGEIGEILSICATNRGTNPGGWFTDPKQSGGGSMIDHTVHVADLIVRLLGSKPEKVRAVTGNELFSGGYEDTAMLTLDFANGVFATIDSSWSRPKSYRTWGDVMLNVVGTRGVFEIDLFAQEIDVYKNVGNSHTMSNYGSSLNRLMIDEFVTSMKEKRIPLTSIEDGLIASAIAIKAYQSVKARASVPI